MLGANYRAIQIKNTHAPGFSPLFIAARSWLIRLHTSTLPVIASEAEGLKRFLALEIVI